jgi:hypothetical protein
MMVIVLAILMQIMDIGVRTSVMCVMRITMELNARCIVVHQIAYMEHAVKVTVLVSVSMMMWMVIGQNPLVLAARMAIMGINALYFVMLLLVSMERVLLKVSVLVTMIRQEDTGVDHLAMSAKKITMVARARSSVTKRHVCTAYVNPVGKPECVHALMTIPLDIGLERVVPAVRTGIMEVFVQHIVLLAMIVFMGHAVLMAFVTVTSMLHMVIGPERLVVYANLDTMERTAKYSVIMTIVAMDTVMPLEHAHATVTACWDIGLEIFVTNARVLIQDQNACSIPALLFRLLHVLWS